MVEACVRGCLWEFWKSGCFCLPVLLFKPEKNRTFVKFYTIQIMSKKKLPGHYCKICGAHKANEKFSGKGHAKHICKECDALPQEKKNEMQYINRILGIAGKYPRSKADWELLRKYARSTKYPEAAELTKDILGWNTSKGDSEDLFDIEDDDIFSDDADIDYIPVFSEKKKFSELDNYEKMVLRDYIYSAITEYLERSDKLLNESELIEIKKQMIVYLEEEHNITLKNDATLRQFFQANATNIINKLQKKREDSQ